MVCSVGGAACAAFAPAVPPLRQPQWSLLLNTSGAFDFSSQGPHTFESAPTLALAVSGSTVITLDLISLEWSATELQHGESIFPPAHSPISKSTLPTRNF